MYYYVEVNNEYREFKEEKEVREYVKGLSKPFKVFLSQKSRIDYVNEEKEKGILLIDSSILMNNYVIPKSKEITEEFKPLGFLKRLLRFFCR